MGIVLTAKSKTYCSGGKMKKSIMIKPGNKLKGWWPGWL
jgi:hypothetical protein